LFLGTRPHVTHSKAPENPVKSVALVEPFQLDLVEARADSRDLARQVKECTKIV
jgi:hypothetical protein